MLCQPRLIKFIRPGRVAGARWRCRPGRGCEVETKTQHARGPAGGAKERPRCMTMTHETRETSTSESSTTQCNCSDWDESACDLCKG